jgi:hypothetical protein
MTSRALKSYRRKANWLMKMQEAKRWTRHVDQQVLSQKRSVSQCFCYFSLGFQNFGLQRCNDVNSWLNMGMQIWSSIASESALWMKAPSYLCAHAPNKEIQYSCWCIGLNPRKPTNFLHPLSTPHIPATCAYLILTLGSCSHPCPHLHRLC